MRERKLCYRAEEKNDTSCQHHTWSITISSVEPVDNAQCDVYRDNSCSFLHSFYTHTTFADSTVTSSVWKDSSEEERGKRSQSPPVINWHRTGNLKEWPDNNTYLPVLCVQLTSQGVDTNVRPDFFCFEINYCLHIFIYSGSKSWALF